MWDEQDCPYGEEECPFAEEGHYFGHGMFNVVCGADAECCPFHKKENEK